MKETKIERYNTARQMFYGFLATVSKAYYNVASLIKNFIPEHTVDLQKEQDRLALAEAYEIACRGTLTDPYRCETVDKKKEAPASFKAFCKYL